MKLERNKASSAGRKFVLFLVVALFFMWGVANNLNDVLIAQFKRAFELSDFQSGLVQSSFYFGYFVFAIPAALLMRRFGYKSGIVVGLLLYAAGAFLFVPAAAAREYSFFLAALFVIASGLAFLETSANPLVGELGDKKTADQRLNFAQAFNPLGSLAGVFIGKYFIFSETAISERERAEMSPAMLDAYLAGEVRAVEGPYLAIGTIVLVWAALVMLARFPRVDVPKDAVAESGILRLFSRRYWRLWYGVVSQFFYVGAQVGIWSYLIRYTQLAIPSASERTGADYLMLSLVLFMLGRFVGAALMSKFAATRLMLVFAVINVTLMAVGVFFVGKLGLYSLVASSFFMSIMFPTIFSVSLRNLATERKSASSLLVMSIIGGAILTAAMGRVSDLSAINWAFLIPLLSFAIISAFSLLHESGRSNAARVVALESNTGSK